MPNPTALTNSCTSRPPPAPQTSHGSLSAPVGRAALAAMSVTGAAALRAWRADVAAAALGTWHETTRRLLYEYGGYVVGSIWWHHHRSTGGPGSGGIPGQWPAIIA